MESGRSHVRVDCEKLTSEKNVCCSGTTPVQVESYVNKSVEILDNLAIIDADGQKVVAELSGPGMDCTEIALCYTVGTQVNENVSPDNIFDNMQCEKLSIRESKIKSSRKRRRKAQVSNSIGPSDMQTETHKSYLCRNKFGRLATCYRPLPDTFLLGGCIHDPLNLECAPDRGQSECTKELSSQLDPSRRHLVDILIPPNTVDPLNLEHNILENVTKDKGTKKIRVFKRALLKDNSHMNQAAMATASCEMQTEKPVDIVKDRTCKQPYNLFGKNAMRRKFCQPNVHDKIVSPVVPQLSTRRKKALSEHRQLQKRNSALVVDHVDGHCSQSHKHYKMVTAKKSSRINIRITAKKSIPIMHVSLTSKKLTNPTNEIGIEARKAQTHSNEISNLQKNNNKDSTTKGKCEKFIHGNYCAYYGYRNAGGEDDDRMKCFEKDFFSGRDVLDIGCNVGHLTLRIARDFQPRRILGLDIDAHLIAAAKKNIKYYISDEARFPKLMKTAYGRIEASSQLKDQNAFPHNVQFQPVIFNEFIMNIDLGQLVK